MLALQGWVAPNIEAATSSSRNPGLGSSRIQELSHGASRWVPFGDAGCLVIRYACCRWRLRATGAILACSARCSEFRQIHVYETGEDCGFPEALLLSGFSPSHQVQEACLRPGKGLGAPRFSAIKRRLWRLKEFFARRHPDVLTTVRLTKS
jgi:hypothetical protein